MNKTLLYINCFIVCLLQAGDAYTTMIGLQLGAVEVNPIMRAFIHLPYGIIALKALCSLVVILCFNSSFKRRAKDFVWVCVVHHCILIYIIAQNFYVISLLS